jgi:hypothetical protein
MFTFLLRRPLTATSLEPLSGVQDRVGGCVLDQMLFVIDRDAYEGAEELMSGWGEAALAEAASRAERSRDLGNHIHYTRWCRVGRAILLLGDPEPAATLH